jgi:ATP-binding cassette, subfamily B, bacterial MsbA
MIAFENNKYAVKDSYRRLYGYAKKYILVISLGIFCGMIAGGTWLPIFRIIQPVLITMQRAQNDINTKAEIAPVANSKIDPGGLNFSAGASASSGESLLSPGKPDSVRKLEEKIKKINLYTEKMGVTLLDQEGHVRNLYLTVAFFIIPLVLVVRMATVYLNQYCLQWAGKMVIRDLRNHLFSHLQQQSLSFFGQVNLGDIMSRCNSDPQFVEGVISTTIAQLCRAPFEVLASLGFVIYFAITNEMLEIIVLGLVGYPFCLWLLLKFRRKVSKYVGNMLGNMAKVSNVLVENLTGIRLVKAYHMEEVETEKFRKNNEQVSNCLIKGSAIGLLIDPLMEMANIILCLVFIIICFFRGKTFADIIPLLIPLVVAYKPIKSISNIYMSVLGGAYALGRIYSLLDTHTELPVISNPVRKKSFEKEIKFDHVDFKYGGKSNQVISDVSFTLAKGKVVAVVGSTGSGKTTLANLLARFYDPTGGVVSIDGIDLKQLDVSDLRNLIGVVTQEAILFNTTIATNLAYGRMDATQAEIEDMANLANAHQFIVNHPDGYNRKVGDKGFVLSGGERQRISIARAMLRNPPILILDEATSALDTITEQKVQEAINLLMQNRTVFVIAHRLSTVRHADTILVLEKGKIVEQGTHEELYEKNGIYRRLCDGQKKQAI